MASLEEKVKCILWLAELKKMSSVRGKFRSHYKKDAPPPANSIRNWMKKFKETGSINDKLRSGRPSVGADTVAIVQNLFEGSAKISLKRAADELNLPKSTVHKILNIRVNNQGTKLQHEATDQNHKRK